MSVMRIVLTPILLSLIAMPALAQSGPTMMKTYGDWSVYAYQNAGVKNCYVLTVPQQALPDSVAHGDNFFLVAPKPSGSGYYPQAIMGYDVRNGSQMSVSVGDANFVLIPKGNSGWTQQDSSDAALIQAMRSGSEMTLKAVSGRGTQTSYRFSLSGISAALDAAASCG